VETVLHSFIHIDYRPGGDGTVFFAHPNHPPALNYKIDFVLGVGLLRVGLPGLQDVKAETQSRGDEEFMIPLTKPSVFCDDAFKFKCVHISPWV
jgi:hypothetical protein